MTLDMAARLGAVVLFTPPFILPALAVTAVGAWVGQVYVQAQLPIKREMSIARAPILEIVGGALAGLREPRYDEKVSQNTDGCYVKRPFARMVPRELSRRRPRFASIVTCGLEGHFTAYNGRWLRNNIVSHS